MFIITERELKKRWESLRTQYNRYNRTCASGISRTARQGWVLQRLKFLDPHLRKKDTQSTLDFQEAVGDTLREDLEMVVEQSSSSCSPFNGPDVDTESGIEGVRADHARQLASAPKRKRKRRPGAQEQEDLAGQRAQLLQDLSSTLQAIGKEDEISVFCKFADSRMRLIADRAHLMYVQNTIQQTLIRVLAAQTSGRDPVSRGSPGAAHAASGPPRTRLDAAGPLIGKRSPGDVEDAPPDTPAPSQSSSDEDELFFKSLVQTLKRLPPPKKAAAKLQIHQLLFDAEFN
ncbi:hypothetical protein AAFF_G00231630 [Aldrovandia affinis]|uniref:BESS domain-containing protein n=1 Tax=Aldrovandia affinis TaxID=143900 RepID=A0AAD7W4Z7_9TELE|nr:hypothetical protein AAFF_G00231630 [Aldrovandia affinis]